MNYSYRRNIGKNINDSQVNTVVFVDYDNVYITLDKNYVNFERLDLRKDVILEIENKYKRDKICESKLFLDFGKIKLTDDEFSTFKNNHIRLEHVYSGKNASDVYLMLDIMKTLSHDNEINKFIIISSDSDMLPIINELKRRRKEVVVGYFEINTDLKYIEYLNKITDECFSIEKLLHLKKYIPNNIDKFKDNEFIRKILPKLDAIIEEIYKSFLKKDEHGKIKSVGTVNKGNLREKLEYYSIFPIEDFKAGFAIQTLLSEKIIYEYITPSGYGTLLINQQLLTDNNISFNISIKEADFKY